MNEMKLSMSFRPTILRLVVVCLLSIGTVSLSGEGLPRVLFEFVPLGKGEVLFYSEDRSGNTTTGSVYRNRKDETNLIFRSDKAQRFGPKYQSDDGRMMFLSCRDSGERIQDHTLYLFDGTRGIVASIANVSGIVEISLDGQYTVFSDFGWTHEEYQLAKRNMSRVVIISNFELKVHSDYSVEGDLRIDQDPIFKYDPLKRTFRFYVTRDDYHRETFEIDLGTKTVKSVFRSRDIDVGK